MPNMFSFKLLLLFKLAICAPQTAPPETLTATSNSGAALFNCESNVKENSQIWFLPNLPANLTEIQFNQASVVLMPSGSQAFFSWDTAAAVLDTDLTGYKGASPSNLITIPKGTFAVGPPTVTRNASAVADISMMTDASAPITVQGDASVGETCNLVGTAKGISFSL